MDRSYPYSRRLLSRARVHKRLAIAAAAGLVAATALFTLTWKPDPISAALPARGLQLPSPSAASVTGVPSQRGLRRVYPYSVVPGGVSGPVELKRIIRTDRVVAAHYARFDTDKARAVVVDKPRAVHVSYRKGDKVYWTAHKVMLAPGETLLSDGSNEMRARCANRISELPQYPVEAHRPAMAELDEPVELGAEEEYAFGPDGMPVAMDGPGGVGRQAGTRFATQGGSAGASADGAPAGALSSGSGSAGPVASLGQSGSSSSLGSRPVAAQTAKPASSPEPGAAVDTGSGGTGPSAAPAPSGGDNGEPAGTPLPGTTTAPPAETAPIPGSPAAGLEPTPVPVAGRPAQLPPIPSTETDSGGGSATAPLPSQPAPATEPLSPIPTPEPPALPGSVEPPAPTEVPEPASLWLFGLALAAMGALHVLRRPRRP